MVPEGLKILFFIINLVLTVASTGFYLLVFGKGSSAVYKWSFVGHWSLRLGLAMIISGAFLTMLSVPTPNYIQLFRAGGLALIFTWAFFFHYKFFKRG